MTQVQVKCDMTHCKNLATLMFEVSDDDSGSATYARTCPEHIEATVGWLKGLERKQIKFLEVEAPEGSPWDWWIDIFNYRMNKELHQTIKELHEEVGGYDPEWDATDFNHPDFDEE